MATKKQSKKGPAPRRSAKKRPVREAKKRHVKAIAKSKAKRAKPKKTVQPKVKQKTQRAAKMASKLMRAPALKAPKRSGETADVERLLREMTEEERARSNGLKAFATVEKVLTRFGWKPEETEEEAVYRVDLGAYHIPLKDAHAVVRVDVERFIFLFTFRDRAGPKQRPEVAEFITRANFDMAIGNFELNYETGEVRFKSSVDFSHVELSELLVRNAILCAVDVVEAFGNQLAEVARGEKKGRVAVAEVEAKL